MDIKIAMQNLDNLIARSHMTRDEHIGMQESLKFLGTEAEKEKVEDAEVSVEAAVNIGAEAGRFSEQEAARIAAERETKKEAPEAPGDEGDNG